MRVNMCRVFRQTALQYADVPAVINVERNRRFSYARMHEISKYLFKATDQPSAGRL